MSIRFYINLKYVNEPPVSIISCWLAKSQTRQARRLQDIGDRKACNTGWRVSNSKAILSRSNSSRDSLS